MQARFKIVVVMFSFVMFGEIARANTDFNTKYSFVGDFKMTLQAGQICESYFLPSHQIAQVNFVGSSSRTIVVNMKADDGQQGPLLGLNLAGLYGSGDFKAERTLVAHDRKTSIVLEGYVQASYIAFELTVQQFDSAGNMLCEAKGDFSGNPGL